MVIGLVLFFVLGKFVALTYEFVGVIAFLLIDPRFWLASIFLLPTALLLVDTI